jgi:hypothetical protein
MVLTRSMAAKLHNPKPTIEYSPNRYNPDTRISLVTEHNIKNRNLIISDMYDILNDIRYKSNKNNGIIDNNDLRPLLFSAMGIFYDKINKTILKIEKTLPSYFTYVMHREYIEQMRVLNETLIRLQDIDIQFRQSGVNCHFGDFNKDNAVLEGFVEEQISQIYTQWITPYDIIQMDLFGDLKTMFDNYIDTLKSATSANSKLQDFFSEELCPYNFTNGSIYSYISNIKFVAMSL